MEYRFFKLNEDACKLLFPHDDGASGDCSDASGSIEQLLDHAANPAHDECRLVASVTNQEFLIVLCVASWMMCKAADLQIDASVPAVQVRRVEYVSLSTNANKKWRSE